MPRDSAEKLLARRHVIEAARSQNINVIEDDDDDNIQAVSPERRAAKPVQVDNVGSKSNSRGGDPQRPLPRLSPTAKARSDLQYLAAEGMDRIHHDITNRSILNHKPSELSGRAEDARSIGKTFAEHQQQGGQTPYSVTQNGKPQRSSLGNSLAETLSQSPNIGGVASQAESDSDADTALRKSIEAVRQSRPPKRIQEEPDGKEMDDAASAQLTSDVLAADTLEQDDPPSARTSDTNRLTDSQADISMTDAPAIKLKLSLPKLPPNEAVAVANSMPSLSANPVDHEIEEDQTRDDVTMDEHDTFSLNSMEAELRLCMNDMREDREFGTRLLLERSAQQMRTCPNSLIDLDCPDPFKTLSLDNCSESHETPLGLHSIVLGHEKRKDTKLQIPAIPFRSQGLVSQYYKSIARLQRSVLAKPEIDLRYQPYFREDERAITGEEDENRTHMRQALQEWFENRGESTPLQQLCHEKAELWLEYVSELLRNLEIDLQHLLHFCLRPNIDEEAVDTDGSDEAQIAWIERSESCERCRLPIDIQEWHQAYLSVPEPTPREFARAAIFSRAFRIVTDIHIWHIVSIAPSIQMIFRKIQGELPAMISKAEEFVCLICHTFNCNLHGEYDDRDFEDETYDLQCAANWSPSKNTVSLKPVSKHACNIFCSDLTIDCHDLLGRNHLGEIVGHYNKKLFDGQLDSLNAARCSDACYWEIDERPNCRLDEIQTVCINAPISGLSADEAAEFSTIKKVFHKELRSPCKIASSLKTMSCMDVFKQLCIELCQNPHPVQAPRRKLVSRSFWKESTNSWKVSERALFQPCSHDGPCAETKNCSCYAAQTPCESICGCHNSCTWRFRGCVCKRGGRIVCFDDDNCSCWINGRECDPLLCGSCGVSTVLDPLLRRNPKSRKGDCNNASIQLGIPARTLKGISQVHGWGLYAGEELKEHDFIGEYVGEFINNPEARRRGAVADRRGYEYLFDVNDWSIEGSSMIDGTKAGAKVRFINNSNLVQNINVQAHTLFCTGVSRLGLWAKETVHAGDELFFNYGYNKEKSRLMWEKDHAGNKPRSAEQDDYNGNDDDPDNLSPGALARRGVARKAGSSSKSTHNNRRSAPASQPRAVNITRLPFIRGGQAIAVHEKKRKRAAPIAYEDEPFLNTGVANIDLRENMCDPSSALPSKKDQVARAEKFSNLEKRQTPEIAESADEASGETEPGNSVRRKERLSQVDDSDEFAHDSINESNEDSYEESKDDVGGRPGRRMGGASQRQGWLTRKHNLEGNTSRPSRKSVVAVKTRSRLSATGKIRGVMTAAGSYKGTGGRPSRKRAL